MNKVLVKEKGVGEGKGCWAISGPYPLRRELASVHCELIRASALFSLGTLVTLPPPPKIHVRMNVVPLLAFVDSYSDI